VSCTFPSLRGSSSSGLDWHPDRPIKKTHLRRSPHPSSLRRTLKYASLLRISGALHLGIFDQPPEMKILNNLRMFLFFPAEADPWSRFVRSDVNFLRFVLTCVLMVVISKRLRKALPLFFFLFTLFGTLRGVFPSPAGAPPSFSPNFSYDIQSHRLSVYIDPFQHTIKGKDQLEIHPRGKRAQISLLLNSRIKVNEIVSVRTGQPLQWVETFFSDTVRRLDVSVPNRTNSLSISYEGLIYDPVLKEKGLQFVRGDQTSGLIGPEGVYLSSSSHCIRTDPIPSVFSKQRSRLRHPFVWSPRGSLSPKN
jgi:hypothetical protein